MVLEVAVPVRGEPRPASLYLPDGDVAGTIVFVQGSGPGTAGGFPSLGARFASLGIACLIVEKVMDGYTKLRRDYDTLACDARDALVWAHSRPDLERRPVALLGFSEGGWVSTKAAALAPELIDLLVLCSSPLTTPRAQTAYHQANADPGSSRTMRRIRYGLAWAIMSLADYGDCDVIPLLRSVPVPVVLAVGADDPTIDVGLARDVFVRNRPHDPAPFIVSESGHHLMRNGPPPSPPSSPAARSCARTDPCPRLR
ncbi:alpha/beta hydrolase [Planctomonas sp. JC2975]|uniref:alpha/beta hydrolase family protein n=1 Tax=Planctomonas sp. JC2975 TaxID=2729626 RepID=UPI00147460C6|nr:alpha/beta hydrolase [Planctomonas sp. JC2975]NNC13843.1 alpha/beta hydrolase [Planctomonas sp. JC2975]